MATVAKDPSETGLAEGKARTTQRAKTLKLERDIFHVGDGGPYE